MSAKTIKTSAWPHKNGRAPAIEMVAVYRTLTHVLMPNGSMPRAAYELTRSAHPDLALPAFDELPLHSSVFHSTIQ